MSSDRPQVEFSEQTSSNPQEVNKKLEKKNESKVKAFLRMHKKLVSAALVLSSVTIATAPVLFRVAATAAEIGVPYLMYKDDPVNRGQITSSTQEAMRFWPEDAQDILIPLLDRIDEGKEIGDSFIGPLIASSYGIEVDTEPVLSEWQLLDEAESLRNNLGEPYAANAELIEKQVLAFQRLTDESVPFEQRLSLLPTTEEMRVAFPNLEDFMLDRQFHQLVFVHVHQETNPSLSVEQLLTLYEKYGYYFNYTLERLEQVKDLENILEDQQFSSEAFEFYWNTFKPFFEDKTQLYLTISDKFIYSGDDDIITAIHTYGITHPALIWVIAEGKTATFQRLLNGLESPLFYKEAYDISEAQLTAELTSLANFSPTSETFAEQQEEAKIFLRNIDYQLFGESTQASDNEFTPSDVETDQGDPAQQLIDNYNLSHGRESTSPEDDLRIAHLALEMAPDNADALFKAMYSLTIGQSPISPTATDTKWNVEDIEHFYRTLFFTFPELPQATVIQASENIIWENIRTGVQDPPTLHHRTLVSIVAAEDSLGTISDIKNPDITSRLVKDLLEPMILQDVLLDPLELPSHIDGLTTIENEHFTGVYGTIDLSSIRLTTDVFHRNDPLESNHLAVVIPWSFFLSEATQAVDGGIINPAVQRDDNNEIVPVSAPVGEGDLNIPENAAKKMLAITDQGEILERPWSAFGSSDNEIRENLGAEGTVAAFTPNYIYDRTAEVPLTQLGMLDDHQSTFFIVYENTDGQHQAGFLFLKPRPGETLPAQEILNVAQEHGPDGFTIQSIAWGDPGYGLYYRDKDQTENGSLIGLTERETYRVTFQLE